MWGDGFPCLSGWDFIRGNSVKASGEYCQGWHDMPKYKLFNWRIKMETEIDILLKGDIIHFTNIDKHDS